MPPPAAPPSGDADASKRGDVLDARHERPRPPRVGAAVESSRRRRPHHRRRRRSTRAATRQRATRQAARGTSRATSHLHIDATAYGISQRQRRMTRTNARGIADRRHGWGRWGASLRTDGRRAAPPFRARATHLSARRPSEGQGTHCAACGAAECTTAQVGHQAPHGNRRFLSYFVLAGSESRVSHHHRKERVCELSKYEELPVKYDQMLIRV